jgi:hypothetical protein
MKKGFVFALLMVAVVAMAFPALAKAPTIKDLPDIIIGDTGDIAGSGTTATRLYRYLNVFNLLDPNVITWNNGYPLAQHNVFVHQLDTADPTIAASQATAFVHMLTAGEYTTVMGGGTPPASSNVIDAATTFTFLSLMNTDLMTGTPAGAYAATATANGVTTSAIASADLGDTDMVLIAAEIDLPTTSPTLIAEKAFTVTTLMDSADLTSGGVTEVLNFDFAGGLAQGWVATTNFNDAQFGVATTATDATSGAIGWNASGTSGGTLGANYGTWYLSNNGTSAQFLIPGAGQEEKVYRVRAGLTSDQTTRANTCSWRLIAISYQNVAWQGVQALTIGGTDAVIDAPSVSAPVEAQLHFAVPYDLSEWGDAGALNATDWVTLVGGNAPTDGRDYNLTFDGLDFGDAGTLLMDYCVIESYARPADKATADITWGSGGLAFNSATDGFGFPTLIPADFPAGGALGTASSTAGSCTLSMGTITGYKWTQASQNLAVATQTYPETAGELVRYKVTCSSSNPDICPVYRFQTTPADSAASFASDLTIYYDAFGPFSTRNYITAAAYAAPGAPKTTGSVVDVYRYIMNTSGTRVLSFYWDAYGMAPDAAAVTNGWAAQTGSITVSSIELNGGLANP